MGSPTEGPGGCIRMRFHHAGQRYVAPCMGSTERSGGCDPGQRFVAPLGAPQKAPVAARVACGSSTHAGVS
eukprot:2626691-Pyramimonas_sp.AAC.2